MAAIRERFKDRDRLRNAPSQQTPATADKPCDGQAFKPVASQAQRIDAALVIQRRKFHQIKCGWRLEWRQLLLKFRINPNP